MPHDKIRAAARERMAKTGEPYTAARRAVASEHHATAASGLPAGGNYVLQMSGEIHDWLADLRGSDDTAALRVTKALVRLIQDGPSLGDPLVVSTAGSWPWALRVALDRSYQESLERLSALRRGVVDAAVLVKDLNEHVAELDHARATAEDARRRALDADRPQDAAEAEATLAATGQRAAEARLLLDKMIEARRRLGEQSQRLQTQVEAARARKEALKASYAAVRGSLRAREAIAALDETSDGDGGQQAQAGGETNSGEARLADITAAMEREAGQQARPEGLMELWPGAPWHDDIRILFAVEPPGAALLLAVLEGNEAVEGRYPEAVMAAADLLRQVRAGQAPEAAAHIYDSAQSFLQEFYPDAIHDSATER